VVALVRISLMCAVFVVARYTIMIDQRSKGSMVMWSRLVVRVGMGKGDEITKGDNTLWGLIWSCRILLDFVV